ncbi:NAD-dependent epimerase/dehydratase family protein [Krasilnikoviella flava]|uniref:UDP-glucose 4-epimerase n=1 Tax=Krasilnikoviella flava TaxID=526729 RepID=A0A1T5LJU5_9MICO|nr:NAD-dependent epimerase/dehydratase family protein [Krasilnikoviella flava]SKC76267.1 UDP-glucose 4-epimerase [Krasilnikoviella flava]
MAHDGAVTWVVGGGGLLGGQLVAGATAAGHTVHASKVPWHDPAAAVSTLARDAERLLGAFGSVDLLWAAGAGVVATGQEALDGEVSVLGAVVDELLAACGRHPGTTVRAFLASSAGGVYAGSADPPFTEATPPSPLSPYGTAKLAAESAVRRLTGCGATVLVGRIANLYGPGQNLAKPQGLITQLCRAEVQRSPLLIYVSLDTARDYVYVRDAARMVLAGMDRLSDVGPGAAVVKILASQTAVTLATIVGELSRITKRRAPIVLGTSASTPFQTRDLRFRSTVWPEVDRLATTTLASGIGATFADVARSLRRPGGPR